MTEEVTPWPELPIELRTHLKDGWKQHIKNMDRALEVERQKNKKLPEKIQAIEDENIRVRGYNKTITTERDILKAKLDMLMRSPGKLRNAMCGTKRSFFAKIHAERVTERMGGRVYTCPICYCFHISTKEPLEITNAAK